MFAKYFKDLTPPEKKRFCAITGISIYTVRNKYLREDPLLRANPRPETIARMILASKAIGRFNLNMHGLRQYFFDDIVTALLNEAINAKNKAGNDNS
jgi:hypothetical protein